MWGEAASQQAEQQQGSIDQYLDRQQLNAKDPMPLIAIDRDGVIVECNGNIKTPDQFVPIDGSIQAISLMRSKGYKVAIIFDQPGISKNELTIPTKGGYYVGDRLVDAKMADKGKLKPILVKTGKYAEDVKKFDSFSNKQLKKKTKVFDNLLEFAISLP